ncbi:MAG: histidinol-phosphate transaminase [Deltaproteobacteria bacterium]|nr:histidinol-phosphate transaminase [Deltaproteobacteria bacterium]
MSRFWSEVTNALSPYVPGEQPQIENIIKLNTNENPYGPAPGVLKAITEQTTGDLRKYPDPNAAALKQTIGGYYGISPSQVFVGNGSDEVLAHLFVAFFKGKRPILFPDITYSFFPVYCRLFEIESRQIPVNDRFEIELDEYAQENGGIIFANPNAPTGIFKPVDAIESLLKTNTDSVVVIDEAYVDFGGQSCIPLVNKYPNLLVVQTLSKSRSLAGLRVGFACGNAELIEGLNRVKNSFNSYPMDRLAIAGAIASFFDDKYLKETTEQIIYNREFLTKGLKKIGFTVLPSKANFVFACHRQDAADIMQQLRERAIIVRHFDAPRIEQFLRITVGTYREIKLLLAALEEIVGA